MRFQPKYPRERAELPEGAAPLERYIELCKQIYERLKLEGKLHDVVAEFTKEQIEETRARGKAELDELLGRYFGEVQWVWEPMPPIVDSLPGAPASRASSAAYSTRAAQPRAHPDMP